MSLEYLATYLNDHLAGSVVALEILAYLENAHAGSPLEPFITQLRADIVADRRELEDLMARLHIAASYPRKVMAWLAEKMTQLKLQLDDPAGGKLRLLEAIEAVGLGIEGKRGLWLALAATAQDSPKLQGTDYGRLERRAEEQRLRVERVRIETARAALNAE